MALSTINGQRGRIRALPRDEHPNYFSVVPITMPSGTITVHKIRSSELMIVNGTSNGCEHEMVHTLCPQPGSNIVDHCWTTATNVNAAIATPAASMASMEQPDKAMMSNTATCGHTTTTVSLRLIVLTRNLVGYTESNHDAAVDIAPRNLFSSSPKHMQQPRQPNSEQIAGSKLRIYAVNVLTLDPVAYTLLQEIPLPFVCTGSLDASGDVVAVGTRDGVVLYDTSSSLPRRFLRGFSIDVLSFL
eukprot:CAMPEP_0194449640 /NCGR_PEP_ID=MMETSP0176-20130528/130267_1 /TAXON_ID=216777 /ORGANISM="Proboscia alata, Strain PI-D3" /LENGTH=244 /DNA_ID=CAMNT_0039276805 /DNA_START=165 /DNA_END=895 /DNA_ORIENTATION=-